MPLTEGFTSEQFQSVRDQLETSLDSGADLGASVCVHFNGEVVVDIWGGYADSDRTTPWKEDTIVNVWSTTKTMTFLATLMLVDRGLVDIDALVTDYWPEFAQAGKESVRVRHFLSHSAGLSGFEMGFDPRDLGNWDVATGALAAQTPWWTPGEQCGYHAVTQGFLLGEIVRRVTGKSFGTFLREEIAGPLGADFMVGVPESEMSRISPIVPCGPGDPGDPELSPIRYKTLHGVGLEASIANEPWWRAAEIPAANGHGNARSVALIQSIIANGGTTNGVRLLRNETVDLVFDTLFEGDDLVLGVPMRYGAGYGLASQTVPVGPRTCFWGGYGGSLIIMDQSLGLTVAYMMNRMDTGLMGDTRGMMIAMSAMAAALS